MSRPRALLALSVLALTACFAFALSAVVTFPMALVAGVTGALWLVPPAEAPGLRAYLWTLLLFFLAIAATWLWQGAWS